MKEIYNLPINSKQIVTATCKQCKQSRQIEYRSYARNKSGLCGKCNDARFGSKNSTKHKRPSIIDTLKNGGIDGISLSELAEITKEERLLPILKGLMAKGNVTKHPKEEHYFWEYESQKQEQTNNETIFTNSTEDYFKEVLSSKGPENRIQRFFRLVREAWSQS